MRTAPATTGAATDVPDKNLQPAVRSEPAQPCPRPPDTHSQGYAGPHKARRLCTSGFCFFLGGGRFPWEHQIYDATLSNLPTSHLFGFGGEVTWGSGDVGSTKEIRCWWIRQGCIISLVLRGRCGWTACTVDPPAVCHQVGLDPAVPVRQLPVRHAPGIRRNAGSEVFLFGR